jgi:hypothetical protein
LWLFRDSDASAGIGPALESEGQRIKAPEDGGIIKID